MTRRAKHEPGMPIGGRLSWAMWWVRGWLDWHFRDLPEIKRHGWVKGKDGWWRPPPDQP